MDKREVLDAMSSVAVTHDKLDNSSFTTLKSAVLEAAPVILYGPPGTGKTRLALMAIKELQTEGSVGEVESVQFHRKFSYEDFIEGFSPSENGFTRKSGIFLSFCSIAKVSDKIAVLMIDEINRADLASTLGEVLFALEDRDERQLKTAHFGTTFSVPRNLAIVATMNTADRGISQIDLAIRRRFEFIPVFPDANQLRNWLTAHPWLVGEFSLEDYLRFFERTNHRIATNPIMGPNLQLGEALFVPREHAIGVNLDGILRVINSVVLPQVDAYVGSAGRNSISDVFNPLVGSEFALRRGISRETLIGIVLESLTDESISQ